jgi:acyl-CoA thioesterase-2
MTVEPATTQGEQGIPAGLFALDEVGPDLFRLPPTHGPLARLFGGQVLAQALASAQRTVSPDRPANSCHAYFVRAGDRTKPMDFAVVRDSDGRSFSTRRVLVTQGDVMILTMSASFHQPESGPSQQFAMPDVPPPESIRPQEELLAAELALLPPHRQAFWGRDLGIDFRAVESIISIAPPIASSTRHLWLRLKKPIGDDQAHHQRMLAYVSDLYLMHSGLLPLGISWAAPDLQDVSLDHALWFHQPFRIDDWLLYVMDSPFSGGARTLARGTFFDRAGRLVASVAQETPQRALTARDRCDDLGSACLLQDAAVVDLLDRAVE